MSEVAYDFSLPIGKDVNTRDPELTRLLAPVHQSLQTLAQEIQDLIDNPVASSSDQAFMESAAFARSAAFIAESNGGSSGINSITKQYIDNLVGMLQAMAASKSDEAFRRSLAYTDTAIAAIPAGVDVLTVQVFS